MKNTPSALVRQTLALTAVMASLSAADDATRANAYDDAWESAWIAHCATIYTTSGKTAGFTLQIGDSITHANPYTQWARSGAGKTSADTSVISWMKANVSFSGTNTDTSNKNGLYLAAADTSSYRGMTASGGIDTAEFLSGSGNGGTAMPSSTDGSTARGLVANGGSYSRDLHITTVAYAFADAQFAVLMLGTNDLGKSRTASAVKANLGTIITTLEARNIVVILSTIPPHYDSGTDVTAAAYSDAIRALAQERSLPLIDFRAEILARRSGTSWNGTLLGLNDVHPSASGGGYTATSNPYADGGNAATHTTGAACTHSGYLLRSWLTVQKMKEVKAYLVDGVPPPSGNATPVAAGQTVTTTQDHAKAITLSASDADSDPLTYAIATSPVHGTLSGTPPAVTYTPGAGYLGSDSFTFTASDGTATSTPGTVNITVSAMALGPPVGTLRDDADNEDGCGFGSGTGATIGFLIALMAMAGLRRPTSRSQKR